MAQKNSYDKETFGTHKQDNAFSKMIRFLGAVVGRCNVYVRGLIAS